MAEIKATNIHKHHGKVTREAREELNGHRGFTIWFTGLSGSGKSTVAVAVEEALYNMSCRTYILDGDNVRFGLNKNLGFSKEDRVENIRRIGEVAKLFRDSGIINLVAFISPFREERDMARALGGPGDFVEIFVDAPLEVCEQRDPKGLYKKARAGQIPDFTGISSPYEAPLKPELHLHTDKHSVEEMTDLVLKYLREQKLIAAG